MSTQLPQSLDSYELYLEDCSSPHNYNKKDRIWRVLRFGQPERRLDRYVCYRYKDYWLTIVENGPQKQIVSAYECEEWPSVDPRKLQYWDHAEDQMRERGIQEKDVRQLFRNCIVYDRTSSRRYRFTGLVWGEKLSVVVKLGRSDFVVTAYWG